MGRPQSLPEAGEALARTQRIVRETQAQHADAGRGALLDHRELRIGEVDTGAAFPGDSATPGGPNRCGRTTVKPAATTRSAKAFTCGVMPGISVMITTPGP